MFEALGDYVDQRFAQEHPGEQRDTSIPIPPVDIQVTMDKLRWHDSVWRATRQNRQESLAMYEISAINERRRIELLDHDIQQAEMLMDDDRDEVDANDFRPGFLDRYCYLPSASF